MNPLVIAVDTGNKNIKTPHTEPFNSGLICHGAIPPAVKSDTLLFDGNYYTLTQSRIPYMYNKTTDWQKAGWLPKVVDCGVIHLGIIETRQG